MTVLQMIKMIMMLGLGATSTLIDTHALQNEDFSDRVGVGAAAPVYE